MPPLKIDSRPTCMLEYRNVVELPKFAEVFDSAKPVEVEIGSGKGRFLVAKASVNRDVQYLGIERQLVRIRRIDKKVQRLGLDNVRIIQLEAKYTVKYFLPESSVRRFYMLFPDPWPKRRHQRRRLFDGEFRDLIWSRLVEGGEIQVATDHPGYYGHISEMLKFDSRFEEVEPFERNEEEQTEFERIFRSKGYSIWGCGFRKAGR